jgi:hypothetical protein
MIADSSIVVVIAAVPDRTVAAAEDLPLMIMTSSHLRLCAPRSARRPPLTEHASALSETRNSGLGKRRQVLTPERAKNQSMRP